MYMYNLHTVHYLSAIFSLSQGYDSGFGQGPGQESHGECMYNVQDNGVCKCTCTRQCDEVILYCSIIVTTVYWVIFLAW